MRYEILGPLRVIDGRNAKTIKAQKVEILLAALVIRPDQVVSTDQLFGEERAPCREGRRERGRAVG
ncbi:hypothetical protein [Streptomyces avermitilis]|uniref:hypothetical protein n=1 Tax=Streptomyces avermitilis TaxID=33903 RepID=UPI003721A789